MCRLQMRTLSAGSSVTEDRQRNKCGTLSETHNALAKPTLHESKVGIAFA